LLASEHIAGYTYFSIEVKLIDVSTQRQLQSLSEERAGLEDMLKEMKRKVRPFPNVGLCDAH
jgi:hypothetical protein